MAATETAPAGRLARTVLAAGLVTFGVGQVVDALGAFGYSGYERVNALGALHDGGVFVSVLGLLAVLAGMALLAFAAVAGRRGMESSGTLIGVRMESIVPPGMEWHYDEWHLSPLIVDQGFGLISGVTGTRPDGSCSEDASTEFAEAFEKLGHVLGAGDMGYGDILEMTTFHIRMRDHLDLFRQVRDRYLSAPWPAWSAIGITELAVPAGDGSVDQEVSWSGVLGRAHVGGVPAHSLVGPPHTVFMATLCASGTRMPLPGSAS